MTQQDILKAPDAPEELADLIDKLMAQGSGHVNISVNGNSPQVSVQTVKSTDCSGAKGACMQPTEEFGDEE